MDDPGLLSLQVYQSEAYQVFMRLQTFSSNYYVFHRNYQELNQLLSSTQNPDTFFDLWTQDKRPELVMVMNEVARLFHNFLASAKTLVDHTRALVDDWYTESKFFEEYKAEVQKRFIGNSTIGFVEELRNYALHFSMPLSRAVVRFATDSDTKQTTPIQTFVIDKAELIKWSKWTAKGRSYLDSAGDEIVIKELADRYFQEINNFQVWMQRRLEDVHMDELNWLNDMGQRVENALNKLRADQSAQDSKSA